jgi:succinate dehydrogenase/fumarate reductase flavoprotein subunit
VSVVTNATLTRLLTESDDADTSVVGVEYERDGAATTLRCDAVILATGGFAFGERAAV